MQCAWLSGGIETKCDKQRRIKMANQPEKKFRAGAVAATIWQNQSPTEGKSYRTVSLERVYMDKSNQWQSTTSMRVNDLPKAALVLSKAYEYLTLQGAE
ncbi:MAG: hypothetical protein QXK37_02445 [Candidatus Woesearchaeota archaeon]